MKAENVMIRGTVQVQEGRIRLKVRGSQRHEQEIEAVIDTGYTEWLTLPPSLIASLGLRWETLGRAILADGSERIFEIYSGEVLWDGEVRRISIDEANTEPLVGMALLSGYELKMQVRPGGKVTIKRLPQAPKDRRRKR
jgi:clan AA aspartic protease